MQGDLKMRRKDKIKSNLIKDLVWELRYNRSGKAANAVKHTALKNTASVIIQGRYAACFADAKIAIIPPNSRIIVTGIEIPQLRLFNIIALIFCIYMVSYRIYSLFIS